MDKKVKTKAVIIYYIYSILLVAGMTISGLFFRKSIEPVNFTVLYLVIVVMSAIWWGTGPSILSTVLGVMAFDFFFVPPYNSFAVDDLRYLYTFVGFFVIAIAVCFLASRVRKQAIEAGEREARTAVLYRFSSELAACETSNEVLGIIRKNVGEIMGCSVAVFMAEEPAAYDNDFPVNEHENSIAGWVYKNGTAAGRGTDTLRSAQGLYVPLNTAQGTAGAMGIYFRDERPVLEAKEMDLLNALASQSAVAVQRAKLGDATRQMELAKQTEKLQATLLNSISHDLRTPLVSITGALSTLKQDYGAIEEKARKELVENAYEESMHLNRLVANLLDMTRVEAGTLKINIKPCELRDVIGASLQTLKDKLDKRDVKINIPEDIFEIPMDFSLMMRVFINLIDNAAKYSAADSSIEISAEKQENEVLINVIDHGFGIPAGDLEHIFDKFYRAVKPRQVSGTGLGLSICKGIVEAHHGRIWAANNKDQGAVIKVLLPLQEKEKGN
jgi:two-component system sensor histidine kinase KdpD